MGPISIDNMTNNIIQGTNLQYRVKSQFVLVDHQVDEQPHRFLTFFLLWIYLNHQYFEHIYP